ncbi:MAG: JAB domain-containing protein [Candidatus Caccovivens sp.]
MENKKTDSEIHKGHRQRLTELVLKNGLENVSDVQAIEWILMYVVPRVDVNPLAHRLLDRYGDFANIIEASVTDLCQIPGISKRTAEKIVGFYEIINYYPNCKLKKKLSLKNSNEFLNFLEQFLRFKPTENLYIFAIDHSFKLIQKRRFDLQQVRQVGLSPYELYDFISSTKPSYIAVAHNHPNGTAHPSKDDHDAVVYIESLIENFECQLLDSFIVGQDGIYSEKQDAFLRHFDEVENILKIK